MSISITVQNASQLVELVDSLKGNITITPQQLAVLKAYAEKQMAQCRKLDALASELEAAIEKYDAALAHNGRNPYTY